MHVIRDSSDTLGLGAKSSNCTAEIIVEGSSPRLNEPRFAIFCSEHDVVVKACMGGRHWLREPLASLPGCELISTQFQGCRFAQPLATCFEAFGFGWVTHFSNACRLTPGFAPVKPSDASYH